LPEFPPHIILAKLCNLDPLPPGIKHARETLMDPLKIDDVGEFTLEALRTVDTTVGTRPERRHSIVIVLDAIDEILVQQQ
jgi:hypothetical protein